MLRNLSAKSFVRGLVSDSFSLNIVVDFRGRVMLSACLCPKHSGRSLRPLIEQSLELGGKHGDGGWNHRRHVLFAFGNQAIDDGREFLGQLINTDRFVLLEYSVVDFFSDSLSLNPRAVFVRGPYYVDHPCNV